jgi:hypothetical protein
MTTTGAAYLMNLTPNDRPRRQTTSHGRPVLASRENASRKRPDSKLESATVTFAPVDDRSCTRHSRAAKPPSSVIHPFCCTDLRTSRFLAAGTFCFQLGNGYPGFLSDGALETVAISLGFSALISAKMPAKLGSPILWVSIPQRGLPGRANATIRSPAGPGQNHGQTGTVHGAVSRH